MGKRRIAHSGTVACPGTQRASPPSSSRFQIGAFAFPKLISETLSAQNGKIDAVSGASYTSAGYIQSLQSALDKRA